LNQHLILFWIPIVDFGRRHVCILCTHFWVRQREPSRGNGSPRLKAASLIHFCLRQWTAAL
jgi:hypothetical protein